MKVVYEHKRAMTLIGFSKRIRQSEGRVQCPAFWADYARRYKRLWQGAEPETAQERAVLDNGIGQYALCVMDEPDKFEYVIAGEDRGGEVPEGMKLYALPESEYAVFTERGALPESLQRLNAAVWGEWLHGEGRACEGNGDTTVEVYPAGDPKRADDECGIWVPVKRKA